jgi:hypothetical protein
MKLTDDHKVEIFCAALNAQIQADAASTMAGGAHQGSGIGALTTVAKADLAAAEAIVKLEKEW